MLCQNDASIPLSRCSYAACAGLMHRWSVNIGVAMMLPNSRMVAANTRSGNNTQLAFSLAA